jgi:hypothetical protein
LGPFVSKLGDTMTGQLVLPRAVFNAPNAASAFNGYSIAGVNYGFVGDRTGVMGAGSGMSIRSEGALYFGTGGGNERLQISINGTVTAIAAAQTIMALTANDAGGGFITIGNTGAPLSRGVLGGGTNVMGAMTPTDFGIVSEAGALFLGSSNIERMRIAPDGTVNVGPWSGTLAAVGDRLQVAGSIGTSGNQFNMLPPGGIPYEFVNRGAGGFDFYGGPTTAQLVRFTGAGDVRIGPYFTGAKLTVGAPSGLVFADFLSGVNADYRGIRFGDPGTLFGSVAMRLDSGELRHAAGFAGWGGLQTFATNGVERMRISANGLVGIRTSNPQSSLHVVGGAGLLVLETTEPIGQNYIAFHDAAGLKGYCGYPSSGQEGLYLSNAEPGGSVVLAAGGGTAQIDGTGVFTYQGYEVGWKNIPRVDVAASGWTPAASHRATMLAFAASGITIVLNQSVFSGGDCFSFVNFYPVNQTIAQGAGVTMHFGSLTGNRTLGPYGICTIWWANAAECWISGAGVS